MFLTLRNGLWLLAAAGLLAITAMPARSADEAPAADPAAAAPAATDAPAEKPKIDVRKLFASNCSWCHDAYGMEGGKGPRLAGTSMTEQQVVERIRNGKSGAMPGFAKVLSPEQIAAFAAYIKSLKVE